MKLHFGTARHNNSMDVRAKQRLCLLACPLLFGGLGGGFAPRHLKRYTSFVMSRIVRWETQFTDAFYPSVVLSATPFPLFSGKGVGAKVVVAPDGIDKYPKYLVDFGEVIVFTSMDEGCCPERDFSSATFDEAITSAKFVCSMQWLNSPWLKSYEGCHDPYSEGKFSHYLIFGGDNNIEIITQNSPTIRVVEQKEVLKMESEV